MAAMSADVGSTGEGWRDLKSVREVSNDVEVSLLSESVSDCHVEKKTGPDE